jgi:hypothetical protein
MACGVVLDVHGVLGRRAARGLEPFSGVIDAMDKLGAVPDLVVVVWSSARAVKTSAALTAAFGPERVARWTVLGQEHCTPDGSKPFAVVTSLLPAVTRWLVVDDDARKVAPTWPLDSTCIINGNSSWVLGRVAHWATTGEPPFTLWARAIALPAPRWYK